MVILQEFVSVTPNIVTTPATPVPETDGANIRNVFLLLHFQQHLLLYYKIRYFTINRWELPVENVLQGN